MIASIVLPAGVFYPAAIGIGLVVVYFTALLIKQKVFNKPGGLFTAKF
jgi:hypothetical protein